MQDSKVTPERQSEQRASDWSLRQRLADDGAAAVALLIASGIAKILSVIKDAVGFLGFFRRYASAPLMRWSVVVTLLMIFVSVAVFIYARLSRRMPQHRVVVGGAVLILMSVLLWPSYGVVRAYLGPDGEVRSLAAVETTWVRQLVDTEQLSGARSFAGTQVAPWRGSDAWTSAQVLCALLRVPKHDHFTDVVHRGFTFLDSQRHDFGREGSGWVGRPGSMWPRTEIAAWVALAYLASLRTGDVWSFSEQATMAQKAGAVLSEIVDRQDPNTGGWGPTRVSLPANDRTYSTVLALWSLLEGRQSGPVSRIVGTQLNDSIRRGVHALMQVPHGSGWLASPGGYEPHASLTALVLYVLSLADRTVFLFNDAEDFSGARLVFLKSFVVLPAMYQETDRAAEFEQELVDQRGKELGESFYVTFLPFPWSVALFAEMARDGSLTKPDRSLAKQHCDALLQQLRVKEGMEYFRRAATYDLAENLIALVSTGVPAQ